MKKFARKKISIIGSGQIGSNLGYMALKHSLGNVVLFDIVPDMPQGKALDIQQAVAVDGYNGSIIGSNSYTDIEGSDIVIITAGIPRKPGMSRDDLLNTNAKIMKDVASNIKKYAPESYVIVISNPLDAMVYLLKTVTGFPSNRVIGMAGVLDAGRFRTFISQATNVHAKDIHAFVLGGHGDTMVPLVRYSYVGGIPLAEYPGITQEQIDSIVERTRKGGGEIVALLKTGSAFYAPASSAILMAKSIIFDEKRIVPAAAYCNGEYGYNDLFIGLPVLLGKEGVEKIIEFRLEPKEKEELDKSANAVEGLKQDLKRLNFI